MTTASATPLDFDQIWEGKGVTRKHASTDRVVLDLPWRQDNKFYHLLWLGVALPLLTGGVSGILVSGLSLVAWIILHFNVTTVTVTRAGVKVEHTFPTPGAGPIEISADALSGLQIQTQQEVQGRWAPRLVSFYSLATTEQSILASWDSEETVGYVRDAIVHVHGEAAIAPLVDLPIDPPPFGVQARSTESGGVELELPWAAHGSYGIHIFGALGLGFLGSGFLGVPFAAASFASWVYLLRNRTIVTLDSEGVRIANGPIPTPWEGDIRLTPGQVHRLRVEERVWGRTAVAEHYNPIHYYDLVLDTRTLLRGWRDPGKLDYVVACAQRLVGADQPVAPPQTRQKRSVHDRVHGRKA